MTTVPQQHNQSSELHLMPIIVFGVVSLVFGFFMWLFVPQMGILPEAASDEAIRTDALFRVLMGIGGVVFFLVQGLIYYAAYAFRAKEGDITDGPNIHGNTMLEIVWTIVPSLIVVFIAIYAYSVWINNTEVPNNPNVMYTPASVTADGEDGSNSVVINAIGQRYAWSFEYITNDFMDVINEDESVTEGAGDRIVINTTDLYIYAGQAVELQMNTLDVIHSFWAPEMRVKQDLLPGRTTSVIFRPRTDITEYEFVWVNSPVTIYSEPDFASDVLVDVPLEDGSLPQPVEFRLVDLEENFESNEDINWIHVFNERGVEGYLPISEDVDYARANRYRLICTELCGGGHGDMFTDIVMFESEEQFMNVWYEPMINMLSVPAGDPFEVGISVIGSYGCSGCHVLNELGWAGAQGPSLEGIGARSTQRADASGEAIGNPVDPGAEYIAQSIRLSQDYLVAGYGAIMPYFHPGSGQGEMPQEDLNGIVAYLCTQTGTGNPADSDCGLQNWEFDENGNFIGDVDALVAELTILTDDYED